MRQTDPCSNHRARSRQPRAAALLQPPLSQSRPLAAILGAKVEPGRVPFEPVMDKEYLVHKDADGVVLVSEPEVAIGTNCQDDWVEGSGRGG